MSSSTPSTSMSSAATTTARTFVKLGGSSGAVLLGRPAVGFTCSSTEPDLVLIYGWMDAQLPHLHKYTESYNRIFPGTPQLLVRSYGNDFLTRQRTLNSRYASALKYLQEEKPNRILLHVFSNGGCYTLVNFNGALRQGPLPIRAAIFDSCPGDSTLSSAANAFTIGIKNTALRYFAAAVTYMFFVGMKIVLTGLGRPSPIEWMRARMQDARCLPHTAPRAYIYSPVDPLISENAVTAHAAEAKALGVDAVLERFDRSGHVNHMKSDPDRYWGIVKKAWGSRAS